MPLSHSVQSCYVLQLSHHHELQVQKALFSM
jgi:hypothetical protein